jgi:hypothetical protein
VNEPSNDPLTKGNRKWVTEGWVVNVVCYDRFYAALCIVVTFKVTFCALNTPLAILIDKSFVIFETNF